MKRIRLLLLAVAGMPLLIHAQSAQVAAVADASAAVPPFKYQSAYAGSAEPGKPAKGNQADPHAGHHMNKKGL